MLRKLKPLAALKKLKSLGPETKLPTIPIYGGTIGEKDEDPAVFEIWQVMGGKEKDRKFAKKCATLKQRLPDATTPELITYVWLTERAIDFQFQVEAAGGRSTTGGSVIDFVVRYGKDWALRVQGSWWHNRQEQLGLDELRKKNLIGSYAGKYQIDGVVDVWEADLNQDRDTVLTLAISGYQLPH